MLNYNPSRIGKGKYFIIHSLEGPFHGPEYAFSYCLELLINHMFLCFCIFKDYDIRAFLNKTAERKRKS